MKGKLLSMLFGASGGAAIVWLAVLYGLIDGPHRTFWYAKLATSGSQWGCSALATAMLNEDIALAASDKFKGKVRVLAERGTDKLSLKVDASGKKLLVMTGADINIGRVDAEEMMIVRDDERTLVAIQITRAADAFVVRFDRQTGNAVWGKVGEFIFGGQVGWVHYLQCR